MDILLIAGEPQSNDVRLRPQSFGSLNVYLRPGFQTKEDVRLFALPPVPENSNRPPTGIGVGDVRIRSGSATIRATAGTQDFIGWDTGPIPTIKGVLFFFSNSVGDGSPTDGLGITVGFTDGLKQACAGVVSEDNLADSNTARVFSFDRICEVPDPNGGASTVVGTFASWIPGGVRINWSLVDGLDHVLTVVFIAGDDASCKVGTFQTPDNTGNPNALQDITGSGFDPNLAFFLGTANIVGLATVSSNAISSAHYSFAMACTDLSLNKHTALMAFAHRDARTTGQPSFYTNDSGEIFSSFAGNPTSPFSKINTLELDSFISGGFRIKDTLGTSNPIIAYMAIRLAGCPMDIQTIDAAPENTSFAATLALPGTAIVFSTSAPALGDQGGSRATGFGYGIVTENNSQSLAVYEEDGVATVNNGSITSIDTAILTPNESGVAGLEYNASIGSTSVLFTKTQNTHADASKQLVLIIHRQTIAVYPTGIASAESFGTADLCNAIDAVVVGTPGAANTSTITSGAGTSSLVGSTFVICASFDTFATPSNPQDSKGNSYSAIGTQQNQGGGSVMMWYSADGDGGSNHSASVDFSGSPFGCVFLIEILGTLTLTDPLDVNTQGADVSEPWELATGALAQADEMVLTICGVGSDGSPTMTHSSSNTTIIAQLTDYNSFWIAAVSKLRVASTSSVTPSFTADGTLSNAPLKLATFKAECVQTIGTILTPTGIGSAEAFGTAVLTPGAVTVSPTGIASAEAFGTAVLAASITVSPTGIASAEAFGTAVLTPGAVTVSPTGIASAEAFGTAVLTPGAVTVSPTGIASAQAFGTPTLTVGATTVTPTGVASAEAFGTAVLTPGAVTVSPTGIASAQAFGTPTLTVGATTVSPTGIPSAEAFGTALIVSGTDIAPAGIASAEAFGTTVVLPGAVTLSPSSIATAEAFGTPAISTQITVIPTGIASGESFGTAAVLVITTVSPTGIASEEAFGTATLTIVLSFDQTVSPSGIDSEETFGIPFLQGGFIPVTLKKKIRDELVRQAKLGTFIAVTYDKDTDELIQGLQVQPQSIEANEITANYKIEDAFGRDFVQDWLRWPWVMILRFETEVIAEAFERSLMDSPICIKRLPGEDRQVHVLLVDAQYTHPPRQESSNGTVVRYRFQAELSRR